jgi:hypothetical protein
MQIRLFLFSVLICQCLAVVASAQSAVSSQQKTVVAATLQSHILAEARWAMQQQPVTVTAQTSTRSAGGKHDFFSEGDYWWPDSTNPQGPYIQRDGMTNPDNFVAHRQAMIRFSRIVGALASAYVITRNETYARQAFRHLNAWFVDSATRMNPSLLYTQAIKGRATGRGIGIIDTIHLMEVAQGLRVMQTAKSSDKRVVTAVHQWFANYLVWLTTHPYGKDEMNAKNNHGTCWVMQVAAFAQLTKNDSLLAFCRNRYKTVLLPDQMVADGRDYRRARYSKRHCLFGAICPEQGELAPETGCDVLERLAGGAPISGFWGRSFRTKRLAKYLEKAGTRSAGRGSVAESAHPKSGYLVITSGRPGTSSRAVFSAFPADRHVSFNPQSR